MELSAGLTFPLLFVLFMCAKINLADEIPMPSDQLSNSDTLLQQHFSKFGYGIPFRPVRRIGSEFLGKRSLDGNWVEEEENVEKRARARMGSEFLGKRRLGSEFLGKRAPNWGNLESGLSESEELFPHHYNYANYLSPNLLGGSRSFEKRALGSEFLGKRRLASPYEWSWKRARLGSEFLGKKKRALESEFLSKRSKDD